jgi:hypothetical protein
MSYTYDPLAATVYTVGATGVGATGQVLVSNGSSMSWSNVGAVGPITGSNSLTGQTLEVKGDANFDGEVTIKGKKLAEVLENIESRLAILHPNEKLEEKWENLRGLRAAYVALEKEILEKEAMWSILKR